METSHSEDAYREFLKNDSYAAACFQSNLKVYQLTLFTPVQFHGITRLVVMTHDDELLYSQMLTVDVYTMANPCVNGHCSGDAIGDPHCEDIQRLVSNFLGAEKSH